MLLGLSPTSRKHGMVESLMYFTMPKNGVGFARFYKLRLRKKDHIIYKQSDNNT
jgi:hypothetical protein